VGTWARDGEQRIVKNEQCMINNIVKLDLDNADIMTGKFVIHNYLKDKNF
jgi:hypothetical protein